ncbi:MAG: LTA synthase family protein, partial [Prevotella sp.]|nr:LTA synthase family protein [Prevotella sp.]
MMKRLGLLSPLAATLCNLLLAYGSYLLARIIFFFENYGYFSQGLTFSHFIEILGGGLMFDTSAILVTNIPYIVLLLFPVYAKENAFYQRLCRTVFLVVNGLALAVNLCDAVYFRFTMRRTTTTVFSEFSNEGNLGGIFLTETLRHFYLVILFVVILWAMYRLYRTTGLRRTDFTWWHYDLATLLSLAVLATFLVAGIRGGY